MGPLAEGTPPFHFSVALTPTRRHWPQGCGLVTMGSHAEAVAAIAALDSQYVWDGMETPMVVKWMDTALQRRRREQHLANMRQAMSPGAGLGFGERATARDGSVGLDPGRDCNGSKQGALTTEPGTRWDIHRPGP